MSFRTRFDDLFRNIRIDNVADLAAKFMYQGFNAEEVMKHLLAIKDSKTISDSDFARDIIELVVLGVVMGNYNENNKKKIDEHGRQLADGLMLKYDLKEGGAKGNRLLVNVPRILATFPDITIKVLMQTPFERNYGNSFGCTILPKFMKTAVFPSIIPTNINDKVKKVLLTLSNCYTAEQTMALRGKDDPLVAFNEQTRFTMLSHDSIYPRNDVRTGLIQTFDFNFGNIMIVLASYSRITGVAIPDITAADFTSAGLRVVQ